MGYPIGEAIALGLYGNSGNGILFFDGFDGSVLGDEWTQVKPVGDPIGVSGGNMNIGTSVSGANFDTYAHMTDTVALVDGVYGMIRFDASSGTNGFRFAPSAGYALDSHVSTIVYPRGPDNSFYRIQTVDVLVDAQVIAFGEDDMHYIIYDASESKWVRKAVWASIIAGNPRLTLYRRAISDSVSFAYAGCGVLGAGKLAPQHSTTSVSASQTFSTNADSFVLYVDITTIPSSGSIEIRFREQDANNYWRITIDGTSVDVDEVVSGTPTNRATIAGFSNGDVLGAEIRDNDDIVIYKQNLAVFGLTAGGSTFRGNTGVTVESLGTGGVIGELRIYDYVLPSAVSSRLNAMRLKGEA